MKGLNKVTLIGNLGDGPDIKIASDGSIASTHLSVATGESYIDKKGDKIERTEWHRVVFFKKLADVAGKYLYKGSRVFIEGSIRSNKWTDKDGVERQSKDIIGSSLLLLDNKPKTAEAAPPASSVDFDDDSVPF